MRIKILAVFALVAALVAIGVIRNVSGKRLQLRDQQKISKLEEKQRTGTIKLAERVELAKAKGETQVDAPGMLSLYPQALNLEDLENILPRYTVVIAKDIRQVGVIEQNESIRSWHKFRILKLLSEAPPVPSYVETKAPTQLLPVNDGEFLMQRIGGTINIEGVEVRSAEPNVPAFQPSGKYLLVLSLDPASRVAQLALGPQSILPLKPDNTADVKNQEHMLQRLLQTYHKNSVDQLTSDLRQRKSP